MGDEKENQQVDVKEVTNPFRFGKAGGWRTQVGIQEEGREAFDKLRAGSGGTSYQRLGVH